MPLYFAYGSNMDRDAMASRCPASSPVGIGRLMRHRFAIFEEGYATVVRDPRHAVWGMVWDLSLSDVPALDRYESLATGLYTKAIQPVLTAQGPRRAVVYIGRGTRPGSPKPGYMEGVVAAAAKAGLPEEYLRHLGQWLGQGATASPAATPAPQPKVRPLWSAPSAALRKPR